MQRIAGWFDRAVTRITSTIKSSGHRLSQFTRRESLLRTVILSLILTALLPVLLYGMVSYYRTRQQVERLITGQLSDIAGGGQQQIADYIQTRGSAMELILNDVQFPALMNAIVNPATVSRSEAVTAPLLVRNYLVLSSQGPGEALFDQIIILDEEGALLAASDSQWINDTFGTTLPPGHDVRIRDIFQRGDSSTLLYSPFAPFTGRFTVATLRTFTLKGSEQTYTAIGFSSTRLFLTVLDQVTSFFPGAQAYYYYKPVGGMLGQGAAPLMNQIPAPSTVLTAILPVVQGTQTTLPLRYTSFDNQPVISTIGAVPNTELFLVLEVPAKTVSATVPFLDAFNFYMLIISLVVLAGVGALLSSQLVSPLLQLTQVARSYADGNFRSRTVITRRDEIGELAGSMNRMAEELDTLYANLEEKVEQRTTQLRAAAEVAQLATSSTRTEEILDKTVELISQRFNYYHTAVYLLDETRGALILKEASGELGEIRLRRARRIPLSEAIIPCWVARSNLPRIIQDTSADVEFQLEDALPETRSLAALPIRIGSETLGVLVIHAEEPRRFDPDAVFVLQTLANQIAGALHNTRLLASAEVNLEETNLLYLLTRRITTAENEPAITDLLLETQAQLPITNALLTLDGDNLHILGLYDSHTRKFERNLATIDIPFQRVREGLAAGQSLFVQDITQPTLFDNLLSFFLRRGCKSALILPAYQNKQVSKILVLGYHEGEHLHQALLQPYVNLIEVVTNAFEKFGIMKSLQQRLTELQILENFSTATSAETDLTRLYRVLHEQIGGIIGSDVSFLIAIKNRGLAQIDIPYLFEDGERIDLAPLPLGQGLVSLVIENRAPLLLAHDTERRAAELGARIYGRPARSWLGVPLLAGGEMVGALVLQDQDHEGRFSQTELNLLSTIAPHIATSIRNAQLVEEMQTALDAYGDEHLLVDTWLRNTPDPIVIKNAQGSYIRASDSVGGFFGRPAADIIGKSDFDLMDQETASRSTEEELEILQEGRPRLRLAEKGVRAETDEWYLASKIPLKNIHHEPAGLLVIRQNITELKKAEEEANRRSAEIRTAAEIAKDASGTLDLAELLSKTIHLIRDRFGFYHASIFLLDALGRNAVLRESTGEAGRRLLANAHKLAVGSQSIVGQATARGEAVVVNDVTGDPTHFPNPLLPDTHAEMALPLKIGPRILGALDVQSTLPGAFGPQDISILSVLADQLAVAIDNAGLFSATQAMLGKHRLLHRLTLETSTADNLSQAMERVSAGLVDARAADRAAVFLSTQGRLDPLALSGFDAAAVAPRLVSHPDAAVNTVFRHKYPILVKDTDGDPRFPALDERSLSTLTLPVLFGDELMGVVSMESDQSAAFDEGDRDIMTALSNNIGVVIANWRLVSQVRRQVERQQDLFEASAKIRRSVDIDTILQTSVAEIGRAMGARRARITLTLAENPSQSETDLQTGVLQTLSSGGANGAKPPKNNGGVQA